MKKLTLNETWKRCLRMWRWIVKEWEKDNTQIVGILKEIWLEKYDPDANLEYDCYFCNYYMESNCSNCPPVLVNKKFRCWNSSYSFDCKPNKFLAKLEQLNKIRLSKLKK